MEKNQVRSKYVTYDIRDVFDPSVDSSTVQWNLIRNGPGRAVAVKKPLLQRGNGNKNPRIELKVQFLCNLMESEGEIFGLNPYHFVRRTCGQNSGGSVMAWWLQPVVLGIVWNTKVPSDFDPSCILLATAEFFSAWQWFQTHCQCSKSPQRNIISYGLRS